VSKDCASREREQKSQHSASHFVSLRRASIAGSGVGARAYISGGVITLLGSPVCSARIPAEKRLLECGSLRRLATLDPAAKLLDANQPAQALELLESLIV
jgi:hypothetical protein